VTLEFVLLEYKKMAEQLTAGHCDILMAGIAITTNNSRDMTFTTPYMDATLALIVKDYRRDEFVNRSALMKLSPFKIGVLDGPYFPSLIKKSLPNAEIVLFDSPREFFKGKGDNLDAFMYTAERGSAWTLLYPDYTVVIPAPDYTKVPLAYAVAHGDTKFINFLNSWLILKQKDATFEKAYKYWILGQGSVSERPRWSIIRDVLHWVD
jgi:ABC-type amino acid transport substrate-binding protein